MYHRDILIESVRLTAVYRISPLDYLQSSLDFIQKSSLKSNPNSKKSKNSDSVRFGLFFCFIINDINIVNIFKIDNVNIFNIDDIMK